jgi:adenylate cyclase
MYKCQICGRIATKEDEGGRSFCYTHYRYRRSHNIVMQIANDGEVFEMTNITELPAMAKRIRMESKRFELLMKQKSISELSEIEKMEIKHYSMEVDELVDSLKSLGIPQMALNHLTKPVNAIKGLMKEAQNAK